MLLSSKKDSADGIKSTTFLEDEMHLIDDRYHTVVSGSLSGIKDSLHVIISTAGGYANEGFCGYREYRYARQILSGEIEDIYTLPIIYEAKDSDDLDYILDINTALACNPRAQENKLLREDLVQLIAYYQQYPEKVNEFKRYRLNIWVNNAKEIYISPERWDKAQYPKGIKPPIGPDTPCYIGVDASKTTDLTAVSCIYDFGDGNYYETHTTYMAKAQIQRLSKTDKAPYEDWIRGGFIKVTGEEIIDDELVADEIERICEDYNVQYVGVDPSFSKSLEIICNKRGIAEGKLVGVDQGSRKLTPGIKQYESLVLSGKIRHLPNPCFRWQLDCCHVYETRYGLALEKGKERKGRGRIDNIDATINAMTCLLAHQAEQATEDAGIGIYIGD